jgi:thiol:disulfide interchange protein
MAITTKFMSFFVIFFLLLGSTSLLAGQGASESTPKKMVDITEMTSESGAQVLAFSDLEAAQDLAKTRRVVLFFYADWCPTCRAARADINQNIATLPSDVSVLYVDYDSATALKSRYGVTYQHTFVQIDPQGQRITVWNGGGSEQIISRVK